MTEIAKLCEGQFARLAKYFESISLTTTDLLDLSPSDLQATATPYDKLLMKLFIKRHLKKYFVHSDPFERYDDENDGHC